jgi:uncharacterized protein DUF5663
MIKLDDNLLNELGLASLPAHEKRALLGHIYNTLQLRVGTILSEQMTQQQLAEFDELIAGAGGVPDPKNPAAAKAMKWLQTHFPNYIKVVEAEMNKLKAEIKGDATKILEAAKSSEDPNSN